MSMALLAKGFYLFREAALYTRLRPERIGEWFRGRPGNDRQQSIFRGDHDPVEGSYSLSFHDLVDVFVAGHLRNHGVPLKTIRSIYERMQGQLGIRHSFCRKELLTDGKALFLENVADAGRAPLCDSFTY